MEEWRDRGGEGREERTRPRRVWESQSESDVNLVWALVRRPRKAWTPKCTSFCLFPSLKEHTAGAACYSSLTTNHAYITLLQTVLQSIPHVFRLISFLPGSHWFQFMSIWENLITRSILAAVYFFVFKYISAGLAYLSVHPLSIPLILRGSQRAGAYPSRHWARGRVHPGQVASQSPGR